VPTYVVGAIGAEVRKLRAEMDDALARAEARAEAAMLSAHGPSGRATGPRAVHKSPRQGGAHLTY
jgi:hypothetical protein